MIISDSALFDEIPVILTATLADEPFAAKQILTRERPFPDHGYLRRTEDRIDSRHLYRAKYYLISIGYEEDEFNASLCDTTRDENCIGIGPFCISEYSHPSYELVNDTCMKTSMQQFSYGMSRGLPIIFSLHGCGGDRISISEEADPNEMYTRARDSCFKIMGTIDSLRRSYAPSETMRCCLQAGVNMYPDLLYMYLDRGFWIDLSDLGNQINIIKALVNYDKQFLLKSRFLLTFMARTDACTAIDNFTADVQKLINGLSSLFGMSPEEVVRLARTNAATFYGKADI